MVTKEQHAQILARQKADREANTQQKTYYEKYRSMSQREVVETQVKAQDELNRQGGTVNIREFLQNKPQSSDPNVAPVRFGAQSLSDVLISKPIDVSQIKDTSWMRGETYKQHEARKTLADYETIPSQIPRGTPKTEDPAARRMGFGGGGAGVANLGYQTITEKSTPENFSQFIAGRINTPIQETIVEEPKVIEETKTVKPDYTKIIIAAVGIFAVLGFVIWRIKK